MYNRHAEKNRHQTKTDGNIGTGLKPRGNRRQKQTPTVAMQTRTGASEMLYVSYLSIELRHEVPERTKYK